MCVKVAHNRTPVVYRIFVSILIFIYKSKIHIIETVCALWEERGKHIAREHMHAALATFIDTEDDVGPAKCYIKHMRR